MAEWISSRDVSHEHLFYCGFFKLSWSRTEWTVGASAPPAEGWQPHIGRRNELFLDGHARSLMPW